MKLSNYSMPHPVLGREDDIEGFFNTKMEYTPNRKESSLLCEYNLVNLTLKKMLKREEAGCYVQIHCPNTHYCKALKLEKTKEIIKIPTKYLRGETKVNFYIIAQTKIDNYRPKGMNRDYANYSFNIAKGDILASDFITHKFIAEKTWEKLQSVSAFMKISRSDKEECPVEYNLDGEKITVYLSIKDYEKYKKIHLDERLASVFHASIVFPALMYAINTFIDEDSPYKDTLWYLYLSQRKENDSELKQISWESQNIPQICQIILKNPLSRELGDINKFIERTLE